MTLDRHRLAKVLALLTSPHDGEVLAAARTAVRLLAAAGLRPKDLAARNPPPNSAASPASGARPWAEARPIPERSNPTVLPESWVDDKNRYGKSSDKPIPRLSRFYERFLRTLTTI